MIVHLYHGIRSRHPGPTMGRLQDELVRRGLDARLHAYGYIGVPLDNGRLRRTILNTATPRSILVAYSNAGAGVHAEADAVCARHLVLISPALPAAAEWPECVETITVWYSPGDRPVRLGGAWAWMANRMPWRWGSARDHHWGRMGIDGPRTDDVRVTAIRMGDHIAHTWFRHPDKVARIADSVTALAGQHQ